MLISATRRDSSSTRSAADSGELVPRSVREVRKTSEVHDSFLAQLREEIASFFPDFLNVGECVQRLEFLHNLGECELSIAVFEYVAPRALYDNCTFGNNTVRSSAFV